MVSAIASTRSLGAPARPGITPQLRPQGEGSSHKAEGSTHGRKVLSHHDSVFPAAGPHPDATQRTPPSARAKHAFRNSLMLRTHSRAHSCRVQKNSIKSARRKWVSSFSASSLGRGMVFPSGSRGACGLDRLVQVTPGLIPTRVEPRAPRSSCRPWKRSPSPNPGAVHQVAA